MASSPRVVLVVEFDVTDLTADERENLTGEVLAQSERNKGDGFGGGSHPSVEVLDTRLEERRS